MPRKPEANPNPEVDERLSLLINDSKKEDHVSLTVINAPNIQPDENPFHYLSSELIMMILSYLPVESLGAFAVTCTLIKDHIYKMQLTKLTIQSGNVVSTEVKKYSELLYEINLQRKYQRLNNQIDAIQRSVIYKLMQSKYGTVAVVGGCLLGFLVGAAGTVGLVFGTAKMDSNGLIQNPGEVTNLAMGVGLPATVALTFSLLTLYFKNNKQKNEIEEIQKGIDDIKVEVTKFKIKNYY